MTPARSSSFPGRVSHPQRAALVVTTVTLAATVVACAATAGDEQTGSGNDSVAAEDTTATEPETDEDDASAVAEEPDSRGPAPDDVGNGILYVNGIKFSDFTGDCEISRDFGREDVGDLNTGDIVTVIGIDNVEAHAEIAMNYVALDAESFTFRDSTGASGVDGPSAEGAITELLELGPRTAEGSRDIVEVRFTGILEDGTTLDADIVCELQNAY